MGKSDNDFHNEQQNLDRVNSQEGKLTRRLPVVVENIRKHAFQNIRQYILQLFDSCDDLFYDLSNRSNNNREQGLYFDSMREIRLKKQCIQRDYLEQFNAGFQALVSPQYKAVTPCAANKLAIVKNDEMEIDVALTNMFTRANDAYSEAIYNLETRLDYLLEGIDLIRENDPLAPEIICRTFADACKANLEISIKPLIILLKQFERFVLKRMGQTYAEVNQLLIDAGVLTNIPRRINKENSLEGSDTSDGKNFNPDGNTSDKPVREQNRYNMPLSRTYNSYDEPFSLDAFKQLLAGLRSNNIKPGSFKSYSNNPGPLISLSQLVDLLDQVQAVIVQDDQYDATRPHLHSVTSQLLSAQSPEKPRAVGEDEDNIINLVATFFEIILDDSNIALKLRDQISRLQIPILKLALRDDTFFSDSSHPARCLINTIAAIGMIYDDERNLDKDKIYRSIVETVKTICHQPVFDNHIFAELFPQLEKIIEKEQRRSATIEERTVQTEIGKSRVKAANKTVRVLLMKKLHNAQLVSTARDFLIDCWLNVMIMTLLKFSEQSREWAMVTQTVDDLIWCCQSNKDAKGLKRLRQLLPGLLERLSVGLDLLGKDNNSIKEELEKIESLIKTNITQACDAVQKEAAVTNEVTDMRDVEDKPKAAIDTQADDPVQKETTAISDTIDVKDIEDKPKAAIDIQADNVVQQETAEVSEVTDVKDIDDRPKTAIERQQQERAKSGYETLKKADAIKPGDWVKYEDKKTGKIIRCKLSTKIKSTDIFLFVNRFGAKVLEKHRSAIANDIQQGHIKVIDNEPFFERVLSTIFTNLKQAK